MQRRQGVCSSILSNSWLHFRWTALQRLLAIWMLCLLSVAGLAHAQGVNTATLSGTVMDPHGLGVTGAKVKVTNSATGAQRTALTDDSCRYNFVGLPPGPYNMTVDVGAGLATYEDSS